MPIAGYGLGKSRRAGSGGRPGVSGSISVGGFTTKPTPPVVARTGRLFDAGLVDDPNLLAYFPLHDGNLVDVVSERKRLTNPSIPLNTLTNYGCTYIPGVGFSSGAENTSNFMHSPTELWINGGDCIVSVVAKLLPNRPWTPSLGFPIIAMERSSAVGVCNGVAWRSNEQSVLAFRLRDGITWWPVSRTAPNDFQTQFHQYIQRTVANYVVDVGIDGSMGAFNSGAGSGSGNAGDVVLPGVTLFGRHVYPIGSEGAYLSEQCSAVICEVSFWKNYEPSVGWSSAWNNAYTVPPMV